MLSRVIRDCYSSHFQRECDVVVFKRSFGILLSGEFVLFLSSAYVISRFDVSIEDIDSAESTINISEREIRRLVCLEKQSRQKLNKI